MLTIAGSGMSPYSLHSVAESLPLDSFDRIVLDRNYGNRTNASLLDRLGERVFLGSFLQCREEMIRYLAQNGDGSLLYVVTGSPLFYSGAASLLDHLEKNLAGFRRESARLVNAPSSCDTFLERMMVDRSACHTLSLHGREEADLNLLLAREWTFLLCDENTPPRLADTLRYMDETGLTLHLGSRLGYENESLRTLSVSELEGLNPDEIREISPFSILIRRNRDLPGQPAGRETYEHDAGMITKPVKRGVALRCLELEPNQLLWDVGAGSGSVAIEAYLRHRVRTVLFEKHPGRIENIRRNLRAHSVPAARIVEGDVMENLIGQTEDPHRIFVGGGGATVAENLPLLYERLRPGGVLVAFYVGLDHLNEAHASLRKAALPFDVTTLELNEFSSSPPMISEAQRMLFILTVRKNEVTP